MRFYKIFALCLVTALIVIGFSVVISLPAKSTDRTNDDIVKVVENYVQFSSKGEFNSLARITEVEIQKSTDESLKSSGGFKLSRRVDNDIEIHQKWVREEFPKFIFDNSLIIKEIQSQIIKDGRAEVVVLLVNENEQVFIPWVFLVKQNKSKESWKIYEILTYGQHKADVMR